MRLKTAAVVTCLLLCAAAQAETTKVHYGTRSTEVLTVFPETGEGHRVVVLVHGGGWCEQKLDTELTSTAEAVRSGLGATVVDVDYPQCGELLNDGLPVIGEESAAVKRAIEWAFANARAYGGRASRLSVIGFSAGSNVSTLAAQRLDKAKPGYVKAVVSDSGPMNLWRILQEETTFAKKVAHVLHCHPVTCETEAKEYSPRFSIDPATCPPELFGTYESDKVPRTQSEEMVEAMGAAGCNAKLSVAAGDGHDPALAKIGAYRFLEAWGG